MIRLQPLPDELDRSYMGALMRFNGWEDEVDAVTRLASWNGTGHLTRRLNPTLELLSQAAGMSLVDFAREHSTLALRRSITSYQSDLEHGCASNLGLVFHSGLRPTRPGAYLCQDCVWEDVACHGRSYWRRSHQTPGLYWCPKHRGPLSVVSDESALYASPSAVLERAAAFSVAWTDQLQATPVVKRFLEICDLLSERSRPLPATAARDVLRVVARQIGLQTYAPKGGLAGQPLLSDAMVEAYPEGWLSQVIPALKDKQRKRVVHAVDGVLWTAKSASSATVYIAALALLHDSSAEAIERLESSPRTAARPTERSDQPISADDARSVYVAAKGNHHRIHRERPNDWYPLTKQLIDSGLPSLPRGPGDPLWAALRAFYAEELPIEECLNLSGEKRREFEALLRAAGKPLEAALQLIYREATAARTSKPRLRPSLDDLDLIGVRATGKAQVASRSVT